jgi:ABC-type antimicrobial peptide transport system permease subunit
MSSSSSSGGIGFFGLLTIVFIVLKLTGYIDWSWFWVISPILVPITFGIGLLIIIVIAWFAENRKKKRLF